MSEIPLDDQKEFDTWLRARWTEKDALLDIFFETGRFPTALTGSIDAGDVSDVQREAASKGFVETHVRLHHWTELGQIFMVLASMAFLCRLPKVFGLWD
jgi:hypothetical protein